VSSKSPKRGGRPGKSIRGRRPGSRPVRADAAANRAKILAAATSAFAEYGDEISLDEIAIRAGVGPGTLHRHFPTKVALVDAALADGVVALARLAAQHAIADEPVGALFSLLTALVERGAQSHALAERLGRSGADVGSAIAHPLRDMRAALATLFRRAQRAGGLRRGLTPGDLDALLAGAYTLHTHAHGGPHLVAMLFDSMRA